MSGKRLYRSRNDRMIAGVCGGLGEYFNIDPTLVRLVLLFLVIWGGGGLLVYLIAWLVIPEAPAEAGTTTVTTVAPTAQEVEPAPTADTQEAAPEEPADDAPSEA